MSIDRLPETKAAPDSLENKVLRENSKVKRRFRSFMNNAGIVVGVFIVFCVIVITTTDIRLASISEITNLGISFFLLLFCTYSMHVTCSDSGMKAGMESVVYKTAISTYDEKKRFLIDGDMQAHLHDFCHDYIARELKNTRMRYLAVVGFTYEEYTEKYMTMDKEQVLALELSKTQKRAILKANSIKPVTLTPEMFVRKISGDGRRAPLGINPRTKKKVHFASKFMSSLIISLGVVMVVIDVTKNPTWSVLATIVLETTVVITNGFSGYKFGFENIVIDTVEFVSDQTDLIDEAIRFIEKKTAKDEIIPNA